MKTDQGLFANRSKLILGLAALGLAASSVLAASELLPPFRVEANGKPIEAGGGNAAPGVMDFTGQSKMDLLVGQFDQGKVLVFTNAGTRTAPKFGAGVWIKAGGADARVPAG